MFKGYRIVGKKSRDNSKLTTIWICNTLREAERMLPLVHRELSYWQYLAIERINGNNYTPVYKRAS